MNLPERFPTAEELGMTGYWILKHGNLSVTNYIPSWWEQFVRGIHPGEYWHPYPWTNAPRKYPTYNP